MMSSPSGSRKEHQLNLCQKLLEVRSSMDLQRSGLTAVDPLFISKFLLMLLGNRKGSFCNTSCICGGGGGGDLNGGF